MSAEGDRLEGVVRDLQKGLGDLKEEQEAMQDWMNLILHKVKSLTGPRSGCNTQLDLSFVKDIMDKQAQRLACLTSEVSAQDRLINRRLQHIGQLEKKVSESLPASPRPGSDCDCVR